MAESKSSSIIQISQLSKSFGITQVLNNINLRVNKGEIFGFLGPNGAGKTTTIRIILNILKPSSGSVKVFGDSSRHIKNSHARIGYLSSEMVLDEDLTGRQYLTFINRVYGNKYKYRIEQLASILDIDLRKKIHNYSTGNKQKIGLIMALSHEPDLLILDEPTSGLDPLVQEKFNKLLLDFRDEGGTVLLSSHILSEVQELCDRVAFIKEGEIIGVKTLSGLKGTTTKRVKVLANPESAKTIKSNFKTLPGLNLLSSKSSELTFAYNGNPKKLLQFFAAQNINDIMIEEPDLEDVFLGIYKEKTGKN